MGTRMDMRSTTKTRVQRRIEKKQALLLVALVLVISVVSFVLGVVVGRHSGESLVAQNMSEPQQIIVADNLVTSVEPPPIVAPPEVDKLTFYDNLSKDETAPIGSGINLPPDTGPSEVVDEIVKDVVSAKPEVAQPIKISSPAQVQAPTPIPAPVVATPAVLNRLPAVTKRGEWVVQVFSSKSAADAGLLRDELGGKGYPAFITEADLGNKGIWYRVYFGPYADKPAAVQAQVYAQTKDKLAGFAKRH